MGRARRQLALGDDMALVDAHEEARLRLRRRHEDEPFPVRAHQQAELSAYARRKRLGFRSAEAAAAARGGGAYLTWRSEAAATGEKP